MRLCLRVLFCMCMRVPALMRVFEATALRGRNRLTVTASLWSSNLEKAFGAIGLGPSLHCHWCPILGLLKSMRSHMALDLTWRRLRNQTSVNWRCQVFRGAILLLSTMSAFLLATGHCPCSAQLSGYTPTIINDGEPYDSHPGRKIVARRRFHVIQNHGMWYMVCGSVNAYINPWPHSWIDDPLPLWEYKPCFDPGTFNII